MPNGYKVPKDLEDQFGFNEQDVEALYIGKASMFPGNREQALRHLVRKVAAEDQARVAGMKEPTVDEITELLIEVAGGKEITAEIESIIGFGEDDLEWEMTGYVDDAHPKMTREQAVYKLSQDYTEFPQSEDAVAEMVAEKEQDPNYSSDFGRIENGGFYMGG
jgi:hypothetical protein